MNVLEYARVKENTSRVRWKLFYMVYMVILLMLGLNGVLRSYVNFIVMFMILQLPFVDFTMYQYPNQLEEGAYSTVIGIFEKQFRKSR